MTAMRLAGQAHFRWQHLIHFSLCQSQAFDTNDLLAAVRTLVARVRPRSIAAIRRRAGAMVHGWLLFTTYPIWSSGVNCFVTIMLLYSV